MANIARITQVVEPEAKALGFDLVRVKIFGRSEVGDEEHTLQIMAENPETGQLVIEECAALSRRVSDVIDTLEAEGETLIEGAYRLEVSSPGIDRPLTRAKDYANWAGHEVRISLLEPIEGNRKSLHGDLAGLESGEHGDVVLIDDKKSGRLSLPLAQIHAAKLVLTNRLLAETKPLIPIDAGEFDEFDEDEAGEINPAETQED